MKMDIFKPMLATDADLNALRFPLLASAKLDGIRAVVRDGVVFSRSNKPIPNAFVQQRLKHLNYFDGELIVGSPMSKTVYRDTVSAVMSHDKTDFDLRYFVFDHVGNMSAPYKHRAEAFDCYNGEQGVFAHTQHEICNLKELLALEEQLLDLGYEGLILRDMGAAYKQGRSTVKEGYLLKMKRFTDAEFEVVGFEERMHNGNVATTNELGRTARSSHQANKTGRGDLGALILRDAAGLVFNVGTGFDDEQRRHFWEVRHTLIGALAKVKYFAIGMKDSPRHPVFLGWRDRRDA